MMNQLLMFAPTDQETVTRLTLTDRVARAVQLLKDHEPAEGYYLAFSGGKDSVVCKKLLQIAGVKFESWYNNTTIDAPELVQFIKRQHPDTHWNFPKMNMMHRVATAPKLPPTRFMRWCCEEYKEGGGKGRIKVFGVRAAESAARKKRWQEVSTDLDGLPAICPIVYWSTDQVWEFIHAFQVPYCSLYDEGFDRMGCIGCPLQSPESQDREFARFPVYEKNWKRAITLNWLKWKDVPNTKTGKPRRQSLFKTADDFWNWWRKARTPDYIRGDCQPSLLWTNEPGTKEGE
jgi:phosphoadenosine phosphosulfate reductase